MENPVFTPAENWFLLAEAYQQGYASGNAKDAFVKGVALSIAEWYNRNVTAEDPGAYGFQRHYQAKKDEVPSTADAEAYANAVWDKYDNKLEGIMTQKWLHLGIMGAHESYTDIRRTGFPKLEYPKDDQAQTNPNIIQRVLYPLSEKNNNTANYKAATASFAVFSGRVCSYSLRKTWKKPSRPQMSIAATATVMAYIFQKRGQRRFFFSGAGESASLSAFSGSPVQG
jgi:hypothetical protein